MVQNNLWNSPAKVGMKVSGKSIDSAQVDKYNNFFDRAFTENEIQDILDEGGATSFQNFKIVSKKKMGNRAMYDAMFNFTGRDKVVRESKYSRLGEAIYQLFPKDTRFEFKKIKYKSYSVERIAVKRGEKIKYLNKSYKGGNFLPNSFFYKK